MKKHLISILSVFIMLISIAFIYGCDTTTEPLIGNSVIKGQVFDNLNAPLANATVKVGSKSTTTGSDGMYELSGFPQGAFYVVFSKQNFKTDSVQKTVNGNDTITANFTMALGEVLIFNGLIVHESVNGQSLSGVNLYDAVVVTEDDPDRDIQFKDSLGTQNNFYFRSGHLSLNPVLAGYRTEFSEKLGELTKAQFDTITRRWDVIGREINPDWDFGYDQTEYFNVFGANQLRPYYSFYLKGRYPGFNSGKRVYGLIFIRDLYLDTASGRYRVVIDIKMNRNEKNLFN